MNAHKTVVKVNGLFYREFDTIREAMRFMRFWLSDHPFDTVGVK